MAADNRCVGGNTVRLPYRRQPDGGVGTRHACIIKKRSVAISITVCPTLPTRSIYRPGLPRRRTSFEDTSRGITTSHRRVRAVPCGKYVAWRLPASGGWAQDRRPPPVPR